MTEVKDRCLIGNAHSRKIYTKELLKGVSIIDRFFRSWIAQVVPLLQKVDFEKHERIRSYSSHVMRFPVREYFCKELVPWNDIRHFIKEPFATELLFMRD